MNSKRIPPILALTALTFIASTFVAGCAPDHPAEETADAETWSVTAWGQRYEVFPEVDALVAGETAVAHTHVTILESFAPMTRGTVEIVLRRADGEQTFRAAEPVRPGIFNVELRPEAAGDYDLAFRISPAAGEEEIPGGRVRVGTPEAPGGVLEAPAPPGADDPGEPLAFLKEQQWRSDFATTWVRAGSLPLSVGGLARVRPSAGGEVLISAPMDVVLRPEPWPYPGQRVERGATLFRFVPRVAAERSLADLEAEVSALQSELTAAGDRLDRLEELLALEAASRREVEEARTRRETLAARHAAANRDLEAARSAREGGGAGAVALRAPFSGQVAAVTASPGQAVATGEPLARLVRTDPVWLAVAADPRGARRLAEGSLAGVVLSFPDGPPVRIEDGVRLVSVSPELEPATGTVGVLLEVPATEGLVLGTTADAQVLLGEAAEGIVVPATALVDDGGVTVAYLQLSGESFARREVRVVTRQGEQVMVAGLTAGQRLVTRGGEAIRRASLMASGEAHGHVH